MADLHANLVGELGLRIVRGDWAPGERIDVDALEPILGASKTAIREALRVIREKGLIDSWPKRGTFVRSRDAWKLLDGDVILWRRAARRDDDRLLSELSQMRDIIEPASARLAAQFRTPEDIAALERAFAEFAAAGEDVNRLESADLEFHRRLLLATHNELMIRLDPVPDHRRVLEAVIAGQPDEAEAAMKYALRESDRDLRSGEPPFERLGG